ncbi:1-acylglycerol-3-phosphate O-acyltransferase [Malassezia vespertilionis]|uniref:1-acyl-sn-glycerol-3-phosphate acyltransferase n=1 Tax=Malassezia vespertilionis TaxID=2020962 RepID=A0A2N1JAP2_9BASI|nr:1-acylglycerol-3-phosphate O-acyltransferase [Malassezia vespertilionis]PKI83626.1 Slc1p [Malassezia vespertilionis]WFD07390.1 1-acylglycerol-3-phosphate O-acyltransferase [Malassezia vespertilionis]
MWGALASVVAVALGALTFASARSSVARYYLNSSLYVFSMGLSSTLGIVYSVMLSIAGKRLNTNAWVAATFYFLIHHLIGFRITMDGEQYLEERPIILVGNHQSVLDIFYLGKIMRERTVIMAKKELRWVPLLGQFMMLGGNIFIDRKSRASAIKTMNEAGEYMHKNKIALFAFPEGTRSHFAVPDLLSFKKGIFHLAIQTKIPIVPVVCENYYRLYDSKTRFDPGNIRLSVLPPISTEGFTEQNLDALMSKVHRAMLAKVHEFDVQADQYDVQSTMHPSQQAQTSWQGGVSGLAARIIGDGGPAHHKKLVDRVATEQRDHQTGKGQAPSSYGLVSAAAANS